MTSVNQTRPARGRSATAPRRSTSRPSGDDRESAILATAERLLHERTLGEISVDDLARGAGLSRPTFYFYFPSKDAVLFTLFGRVIAEANTRADAAIGDCDIAVQAQPAGVWRAINALFEVFGAHRAVTLAGAATRGTSPELDHMWSTFMAKWIDSTTAAIEAERAAGRAPVTIPAHDLAVSLNLMNERTMLAAFADEPGGVPPERMVDALSHIWVAGIYGTQTASAQNGS